LKTKFTSGQARQVISDAGTNEMNLRRRALAHTEQIQRDPHARLASFSNPVLENHRPLKFSVDVPTNPTKFGSIAAVCRIASHSARADTSVIAAIRRRFGSASSTATSPRGLWTRAIAFRRCGDAAISVGVRGTSTENFNRPMIFQNWI